MTVAETLIAMAMKFKQQTGKEPLGFILGPKEYLQLSFECQDDPASPPRKVRIRGFSFNGLKVTVSHKPGISLEVDYDVARMLAQKALNL